jgi:hypothetical protein
VMIAAPTTTARNICTALTPIPDASNTGRFHVSQATIAIDRSPIPAIVRSLPGWGVIEGWAMGYFLSASLVLFNSNALYPAEDHGAFKRVYCYANQARGLFFWLQIEKGMPQDAAFAIAGRPGIVFGSSVARYYGFSPYIGLDVTCQHDEDWGQPMSVTDVHWRFVQYSQSEDGAFWREQSKRKSLGLK